MQCKALCPITWTNFAVQQYLNILDFWVEHNNSTAYSRKIEQAVLRQEEIIRKNPQIGVVRRYRGQVLRCSIILRKYSLFYLIKNNHIIIIDFISNDLLMQENENFNPLEK